MKHMIKFFGGILLLINLIFVVIMFYEKDINKKSDKENLINELKVVITDKNSDREYSEPKFNNFLVNTDTIKVKDISEFYYNLFEFNKNIPLDSLINFVGLIATENINKKQREYFHTKIYNYFVRDSIDYSIGFSGDYYKYIYNRLKSLKNQNNNNILYLYHNVSYKFSCYNMTYPNIVKNTEHNETFIFKGCENYGGDYEFIFIENNNKYLIERYLYHHYYYAHNNNYYNNHKDDFFNIIFKKEE